MSNRWLVLLFAFACLVGEGVFFWQWPYSLTGLLYLPIIHLPSRNHRVAWLLVLTGYESMIERMPILAGLSMIVMIEAVIEFLEGEFDIRSLAFSVGALPGIDLARQFWTAIFASLYALPAPPPVSFLQLASGAVIGFVLHFVLDGVVWVDRRRDVFV